MSFGAGPAPASLLLRHRQLAPNANVKVSPLCLGAMSLGQAGIKRQGECTQEEAFAILDAFYAQGGNFIDTANGYQHGQSEEWVGEWMAKKGNRDEIVLATKFTMPYKMTDKSAVQSNYIGNGSKSLKLSFAASLRKLQTDYVDVLYVHWWDCATSIPELMNSLNHLVVAGKVLYLGISDTPAWVVSKANQYARDHNLAPFVLYQGKWSAATRDFERDILPMCKDEGMGIAPWGPLNQGKFQTKAVFAERDKSGEGRSTATEGDKQISAVLEAVADKKGCTLHQVAIAYVQQKAPYVFPIVGCRTVAHIQGSIDSLKVELSEDEITQIEGAYEFDLGFPHSMLSGAAYEPSGPQKNVQGPADVWLNKMNGCTIDYVLEPQAIRPPKAE